MSNANFAALLDKKADDVEQPKTLPMGTFNWAILEHRFDESAKKKTPFIEFTVSPRGALEDVDEDLLAECTNWQDKKMRLTFYLTDDSLYRLKEFMEHCGIDLTGRTIAEGIPETQGAMFNGYVTHEPSMNDPEKVYANITKTAPVE